MEAMIIGYPPEQSGQISVTATKEEWIEVIRAVTYMTRNDTSEQFVNWLVNQGVYG